MANPKVFFRVPTTLLLIGDVVIHYGMRIKLNNPPYRFKNESINETVYAWYGNVLNADEAIEKLDIPHCWLRSNVWDGQEWTPVQDGIWNVQGTRHARWTVERSA